MMGSVVPVPSAQAADLGLSVCVLARPFLFRRSSGWVVQWVRG